MCLYPKLIPNRRYLPTKKNGGIPPICPDEKLRYVTAACGDCYECRRQKQRQWVVRMSEESRQTPNAYFLTLTVDDKSYKQLKQKYNLKDDNDIATKAIRLCLERVRKQTGKSVKHWFITEMGHEKTERLHLHGIVWGLGNGEVVKSDLIQPFKHCSCLCINFNDKFRLILVSVSVHSAVITSCEWT